ncbi:hypothetical protein PIB30_101939, partial [Stylosanthes scabra]|nr:hypothetical protein [Stylosanthes scabra]
LSQSSIGIKSKVSRIKFNNLEQRFNGHGWQHGWKLHSFHTHQRAFQQQTTTLQWEKLLLLERENE